MRGGVAAEGESPQPSVPPALLDGRHRARPSGGGVLLGGLGAGAFLPVLYRWAGVVRPRALARAHRLQPPQPRRIPQRQPPGQMLIPPARGRAGPGALPNCVVWARQAPRQPRARAGEVRVLEQLPACRRAAEWLPQPSSATLPGGSARTLCGTSRGLGPRAGLLHGPWPARRPPCRRASSGRAVRVWRERLPPCALCGCAPVPVSSFPRRGF